jgi:hypothetical protein
MTLPEVRELGPNLEGLGPQLAVWPRGHYYGLARALDNDRYVAAVPMLFTWAVITGDVNSPLFYDNRWCYHTAEAAVEAAKVWDGVGEPEGWHRHPQSGRRRDLAGNEWVEH